MKQQKMSAFSVRHYWGAIARPFAAVAITRGVRADRPSIGGWWSRDGYLRQSTDRGPIFETLEPRLLLSADLLGLDDDNSDDLAQAMELFDVAPAVFVENHGQWEDESVRFLHNGNGMQVAMTDDGPVFQLSREIETDDAEPEADEPWMNDREPAELEAKQFSAGFVGAEAVTPVGLDPSDAVFNYHFGDESLHRTGVPGFEIVAYEGLYEGIDLHTWGQRSNLKYEFIVEPATDYDQIAVQYEGIAGLSLTDAGELVVDLGDGWDPLVDAAPYVYQEIDGERVEVESQYVLIDDVTYGFELGEYDETRGLVIDPELQWAAYEGERDNQAGSGLAVDSKGNIYTTGFASNQSFFFSQTDVHVTKLSPQGEHIGTTYFGGRDRDWSGDIAVDADDNLLVVGYTESSGWVSGGWMVDHPGGRAGFLAKLDTNGELIWSTYLGGINEDTATAVAVDSTNNALITGWTASAGWVSSDAMLSEHPGRTAGFVAKVGPSGNHLWSTYLGGDQLDYAGYVGGMDVDASDNVFVVGYTESDNWVSGGYLAEHPGAEAGFLVTLDASGSHRWSTYLGGTANDHAQGVAVDNEGNVVVVGFTESTGWVSGGFTNDHAGNQYGLRKHV